MKMADQHAQLHEASSGQNRKQGRSIKPHHLASCQSHEAPKMYEIWRDKKENVTKIVIDPWPHKRTILDGIVVLLITLQIS